MKSHGIILALLLAPPAFLAACSDSGASYSTDEPEELSFDDRASFRAKMESSIDRLQARLEQLKAKAAEGGQEVKAETQELIDDIQVRLGELENRLAEFGTATRENWNDFKRAFQESVDDVERRLEDAFD